MAMELFKLVGSIFIDNDDANNSIAKTDEKAQSVSTTLADGVKTAGKWAAGIATAAVAAGTAIVGAATSAATTADEIDKMSQKIGISAEKYQELSYVLGQNGADVSILQTGVKTLSSAMEKAMDGNATYAGYFEDLGISLTDSWGRMKSQEDILDETLKRLSDMGESAKRTAIGTALLGKSATELGPMFNQGSKAFVELTDRAHELGLIIDDDTVTAGVVLGDTMDDIKKSLGTMATKLASSLMPIVQKVCDFIVENLPIIQAQFDKFMPIIIELADQLMPFIVQLFDMLVPPLLEIVQQLMPPLLALLGPILDLLGPIMLLLQPIIDLLLELINPITKLINELLIPLMPILQKLLEVWMKKLADGIKVLADIISATVSRVVEFFVVRFESLKKTFKGFSEFFKSVFVGDWKAAWQTVKDIFSNIWQGIKEAFKIPVNWIIDGINAFIRGINKIKVPDWVPLVGGKGFSIGEIPTLAKGGVLEKGQTGFLEGNGAEAVVPLENNDKWTAAVAKQMMVALDGTGLGKKLDDILDALEGMDQGIYLDGKTLVGGIAKTMDNQLGRIAAQKARMA